MAPYLPPMVLLEVEAYYPKLDPSMPWELYMQTMEKGSSNSFLKSYIAQMLK